MANYAVPQALSKFEQLKQNVSVWLEAFAAQQRHRKLYRDSVRELRSLSDRDLADLGFNRSMIKSIALEAADKRAKR